jgi:hypothetical protein
MSASLSDSEGEFYAKKNNKARILFSAQILYYTASLSNLLDSIVPRVSQGKE